MGTLIYCKSRSSPFRGAAPAYWTVIVLVTALANPVGDSVADDSSLRIRALINAAWQPVPTSFDLTVFREYNRRPIDAKLLKAIRDSYESDFAFREQSPAMARRWRENPGLREKEFNEAMSMTLAAHREVMYACNRYRWRPGQFRVEQQFFDDAAAFAAQQETGPPAVYTRTFCNVGPTADGLLEGFDYALDHKAAHHTFGTSPAWKTDEVWRFDTIGLGNILLIRAATAKSESASEPVSDPDAIAELAAGERVGGLSVAYESATNASGQPVDRFTLSVTGALGFGASRKASVIETVPGDPGQVLRIESFDGDKLVQLETRSDYRPDGFPGRYRVETYHDDGWLQYDESQVVDVCVNCPLEDAVFQWNPPAGLTLTEVRPDGETVTYPDGRTEFHPQQQPADDRGNVGWMLRFNWILLALFWAIVLWMKFRPKRKSSAETPPPATT